MLKRRLMAVVAALAVCLSVGVVAPASAHAALGSYLYYNSTTGWLHFNDPANNVCHTLDVIAVVVHNNTNAAAVIYQDFNCTIPVGVAAAGAEFALPSGSVRFVGV